MRKILENTCLVTGGKKRDGVSDSHGKHLEKIVHAQSGKALRGVGKVLHLKLCPPLVGSECEVWKPSR